VAQPSQNGGVGRARPPDDYRWGAQVATDLINTAPEVMVSTGDGPADPDMLSRLLVEHGSWPAGVTASPTTADLANVHELRRTLRGLIEAPDESRLGPGHLGRPCRATAHHHESCAVVERGCATTAAPAGGRTAP
jgi:hypothetical protein